MIPDILEDWDKGEKKRVFGEDDGWRNESLASSCIIKCRKVSSTTFFTKGILNEIGYAIRDNPELNVVYVNATLTSMQLKKLEKRWNDIINENDDRLKVAATSVLYFAAASEQVRSQEHEKEAAKGRPDAKRESLESANWTPKGIKAVLRARKPPRASQRHLWSRFWA